MKPEYKIITNIIEKNSRVLDVGCDDGTLMEFLKINKNVDIRGIEISKEKVQICISKGLTVIEGNAELDLKQFPNDSFLLEVPDFLKALKNFLDKSYDEK